MTTRTHLQSSVILLRRCCRVALHDANGTTATNASTCISCSHVPLVVAVLHQALVTPSAKQFYGAHTNAHHATLFMALTNAHRPSGASGILQRACSRSLVSLKGILTTSLKTVCTLTCVHRSPRALFSLIACEQHLHNIPEDCLYLTVRAPTPSCTFCFDCV